MVFIFAIFLILSLYTLTQLYYLSNFLFIPLWHAKVRFYRIGNVGIITFYSYTATCAFLLWYLGRCFFVCGSKSLLWSTKNFRKKPCYRQKMLLRLGIGFWRLRWLRPYLDCWFWYAWIVINSLWFFLSCACSCCWKDSFFWQRSTRTVSCFPLYIVWGVFNLIDEPCFRSIKFYVTPKLLCIQKLLYFYIVFV